MRRACVCLLRQLPVAEFGRQKVAVTHLCTFDRSFPHGGTGKDSDGRSLSLAADAMVRGYLECVLKVIYRSTYVGLFNTRLFFKGSIFLQRTSKSRVITTSTLLCQLIFRYEDYVFNPQTL
jgi:hypothetical protein